jgi:hypothetical protein
MQLVIYQYIALKNVEVSGFGYCGIRFYSNWSASVKAGYKDVIIDNCIVHDCRENGITTFAYDDQNTNFYHHKNFKITNTKVYNITGYAASSHKGSGIVLSQIDSSIIEKCVAYNTGTANSACGGPGGIWVWAANRITIQLCESHHNSSGTSTGCDGLGFDLDGGVTNSILQYCYSHDNDGAGILLGNFSGARPWGNNTVRYNVSVNDARTNNSSITLFTAPNTTWNGLKCYNNTIYVTPSSKNKTPEFGAFQMTDYGTNMLGVECYNNIFQTTSGLPLVSVPTTFVAQNPKFIGNLYIHFRFVFLLLMEQIYTSLSSFRTAGNFCEKNSATNTGLETDPLLINVSKNPLTIYPKPLDSLNAFKISSNSPAKDAGLDLKTLFSIDPGKRDFWNNLIKSGNNFDIGAFEYPTNLNGIFGHKFTNQFINIYPNPSNKDIVIIDLGENIPNDFEINVSSYTGKVMFSKNYLAKDIIDGKIQLDLNELSNGLYLINYTNAIETKTLKLVISR